MKKSFWMLGLSMVFLGTCLSCSQKGENEVENYPTVDVHEINTPGEAMLALKAGNARYVSETSLNPRCGKDRLKETAEHQTPFAAIVSCSDSRVPVEILFDQGVGDIFVIRTAGNNVNSDMVMGSIDYAIEHLGVNAVLVMGHSSCSAVTSVVEEKNIKPFSVGKLLDTILMDIEHYAGKTDSLDAAIRKHTQVQIDRIMMSPHVADKVNKGKLAVKAAYYDLTSGKVTFE